MQRRPTLPIVSTGLLIASNIIGAGILGLPIQTAAAGLGPTLVALIGMWAAMLISAQVITQQAIEAHKQDFDLPSLFGKVLGRVGQIAATIANLILLYGLMVAYLVGAATLILDVLNCPVSKQTVILGVFCIATCLQLLGIEWIRKSNIILMIGLLIAFFTLIALSAPKIKVAHFFHIHWHCIPMALPIMATAFHFHNILPAVAKSLQWDRVAIKKALWLGSSLGLCINLLWIVAVTGALPFQSEDTFCILYAHMHDQPATIPLSRFLQSPMFTFMGLAFAFLAIITSYLVNGRALLGFMKDFLTQTFGTSDYFIELALALFIPLGIALVNPNIFLKALDITGGMGVIVLFGILPGFILLKRSQGKRSRYLGWALVLGFSCALAFQIGTYLGFFC